MKQPTHSILYDRVRLTTVNSIQARSSGHGPLLVLGTGAAPGNRSKGFTLIELLVVIALIAILAGMLLPTLARAKSKGQSIKCVSNVKQLQLGWQMYALDHNDVIPPNIESPDTGGMLKSLPGSWVVGNAQTDTTVSNLQSGVLYSYINNAEVYRCPADKSTVRGQSSLSRTRSYSLDCWLNNDPTLSGFPPDPVFTKHKTAELRNPVQIFTFIDEHEQSIDEGSIVVTHPESVETSDHPNDWLKMPSDRHSQGCSVAFADGHAMPWRWRAPKHYTTSSPLLAFQPAVPPGDLQDLRQMEAWVPLQ